MRIAYLNAQYRKNDSRGRNVHIWQFITQATSLGHEIWTWPGDEHPDARRLDSGRLKSILALRGMDVLYVRLQENPAWSCQYALPPRRGWIGSPLMVWEFNTTPEFNLVMGRSGADVERSIQAFRRYGRGCDLAVCVSRTLADYVQNVLGIRQVLVAPNSPDPQLFCPEAAPVRRIERRADTLNVVWMGSADLRWQNFDLMRKAAEILHRRKEAPRVSFHILGGQFAGMRDMPPNVNYYGAEQYQLLPNWLAVMDVGLCLYLPGPADYGSPLKLFDYLASGLAVVGTPQPQLCEVFEQLGQMDLIVPLDDPAVLADTLLKLAVDRERLRSLGARGRQLIIHQYNWRNTVQKILSEIETILEARQQPGNDRATVDP